MRRDRNANLGLLVVVEELLNIMNERVVGSKIYASCLRCIISS